MRSCEGLNGGFRFGQSYASSFAIQFDRGDLPTALEHHKNFPLKIESGRLNGQRRLPTLDSLNCVLRFLQACSRLLSIEHHRIQFSAAANEFQNLASNCISAGLITRFTALAGTG